MIRPGLYCNFDSQRLVGKALKEVRDKVYFSTKLPMHEVHKSEDFWTYLLQQIERMDTEYIDFYHFHGLNKKTWEDKVLKLGLLEKAEKAKQLGLIRHLSFSFHDVPEARCARLPTAARFPACCCQYNIIDRRNEKAIEYVSGKGLGVVIMGPVGGGNLAEGGQQLLSRLGSTARERAGNGASLCLGQPQCVPWRCRVCPPWSRLSRTLKYAQMANSVPEAGVAKPGLQHRRAEQAG